MFEENDALRLLWEDKQKGLPRKSTLCVKKKMALRNNMYGKNLLTGHTVPRILRAHKKHVPISPSDPEQSHAEG
jgi:hypothetical protein